MDNGRVVHFEDNDQLRDAVEMGLDLYSDGRHQVIGGAANLTGALAVLDQIHAGEVSANVVLTDGNLTPAVGGSDARAIRKHIRELGLAVRVIGLSSKTMEACGVEVDADIPKGSFTADKLVSVIDDLAEPMKS